MTAKAGLRGPGWAGDVAVFDYDDDGCLDVFVPSMFGRSQLYRNSGDGTFTDVTAQTLGQDLARARSAAKVFDYDSDGRLDLFVVDMHSDMWIDAALSRSREASVQHRRFLSPQGPHGKRGGTGLRRQPEERCSRRHGENYDELIFGNALYRNLGGGKFAEISAPPGWRRSGRGASPPATSTTTATRTCSSPSGMGFPYFYWPNSLMMNNGDGTFTDRAAALGVEPPNGGIYLDRDHRRPPAARSSRSAAVADFDGDGRLEIVDQQLQRPPLFPGQQVSPTELRRLSTDRNEEQSGCDRGCGSTLGGQDRYCQTGEPGGRIPIPIESRDCTSVSATRARSTGSRSVGLAGWFKRCKTLRSIPYIRFESRRNDTRR